MGHAIHNMIVSSIWGIAEDVLRDLFKRGKYPDVILPMCVASSGCGLMASPIEILLLPPFFFIFTIGDSND